MIGNRSSITRHIVVLAILGIVAGVAMAATPGNAASPMAHHRVSFEYRAVMRESSLDPQGAELSASAERPSTEANPSVLLSLAETLDVTARYELAGEYSDVSGSLVAALQVNARDGWERTWPLDSTTQIQSSTASGTATIDIADLTARLKAIEQDTGYRPGLYTVAVVFTAKVAATGADGAAIEDTFVAPFTTQLTGTHLLLDTSLRTESPGATALLAAQAPGISLLGIPLVPNSTGGWIAAVALLLLVSGAGFACLRLRSDPRLTKMRLGQDVVRVAITSDSAPARQIHTASLEALARAARMAALPLCYDERRNLYFALDRDVMYLWRDEPAARPVSISPSNAA